MTEVVLATDAAVSEALLWLRREADELGEGFYCNRDVILRSHRERQVYCALEAGAVLGFVVHNIMSVGAAIDILEVHPWQRGRGIGTALAINAVERLFEQQVPWIRVKCAPRSSEAFWRRLGFASEAPYEPSEPPMLVLANGA